MEVKYHLTGLEVESEEDDIGKSVARGPAPGECSVAGGQVWSLKAYFGPVQGEAGLLPGRCGHRPALLGATQLGSEVPKPEAGPSLRTAGWSPRLVCVQEI